MTNNEARMGKIRPNCLRPLLGHSDFVIRHLPPQAALGSLPVRGFVVRLGRKRVYDFGKMLDQVMQQTGHLQNAFDISLVIDNGKSAETTYAHERNGPTDRVVLVHCDWIANHHLGYGHVEASSIG